MAQVTLVDADLSVGRELLDALDARKFAVSSALWLQREEGDEYRLIIATPVVDREGKQAAYMRLAGVLKDAALNDRMPLFRIEAVGESDPTVSLLRRFVSAAGSDVKLRLSNNVFDGVLVPDAYVYRLAKPEARKKRSRA